MKKSLLLFSLLLMMLSGAGCVNTAEENSMPTIDNSTEQTMKKLQNEEDQAMNFNSVSSANMNSPKGTQ